MQDEDWFTFTTSVPGTLSVEVSTWPPFLDTRFELYGPDDPGLAHSNPSAAGTYYVKVYSGADDASIDPYVFSVQHVPEAGYDAGWFDSGQASDAAVGTDTVVGADSAVASDSASVDTYVGADAAAPDSSAAADAGAAGDAGASAEDDDDDDGDDQVGCSGCGAGPAAHARAPLLLVLGLVIAGWRRRRGGHCPPAPAGACTPSPGWRTGRGSAPRRSRRRCSPGPR